MMYFTTCPSATPAPPGASGGSSQGRSMLLEESDLEAFTGAQGDGNTDSRMAVGPNPPQAPRDRPEDGTHASSWQAASERAGGGEGLQNSGGRVDVKSGSTAGHPAALRLGAACLEPLVVSELSAEEVARMWQEYFVFSVVRNPYQRMLSSYKYLLRKVSRVVTVLRRCTPLHGLWLLTGMEPCKLSTAAQLPITHFRSCEILVRHSINSV